MISLANATAISFVLALPASLYLWQRSRSPMTTGSPSSAYVLRNIVTHGRFLPIESSHSFTYPTLSLLLSLTHLESHALDLGGGWMFGYGSRWALTGLNPKRYFGHNRGGTLRQKLEEVLSERGVDAKMRLGEVWLMTMPSYLGFEGVNPLTVWFCYDRDESEKLLLVVLEVHNTFGEQHVYILHVGQGEDDPPPGYKHQWTFPRQFHVSPFNDRSGHYICSVVPPSHPPPPLSTLAPIQQTHPPRPIIKLDLLTPSPPRRKLTAILQTRITAPLTPSALLPALVQTPLALFLTFPRIAYQAFVLHYKKRLDVYARPEQRAVDGEVEHMFGRIRNPVQEQDAPQKKGGATAWQDESRIETWCRERVEKFLTFRVGTIHPPIRVRLISSRSTDPIRVFSNGSNGNDSEGKEPEKRTLDIYYRSPRFFTILVQSLSPTHALLLGSRADNIFSTTHEGLFLEVFGFGVDHSLTKGWMWTWTNRMANTLRRALLPNANILGRAERLLPPSLTLARDSLALPHPLDPDHSSSYSLLLVLFTLVLNAKLEQWIFNALGARFVKGDAPWEVWERLVEVVDCK